MSVVSLFTTLLRYVCVLENNGKQQDINEALDRLPQDVQDARNQRLKRAMDLSCKHVYLSKEMQEKQTPFQYYLQDSIKQVEGERAEKEQLDTPTPYSRQIP